ncbi:MAG: low molecular weight phosphotyrosine protein phosphatase [Deltaproteobacteria bacterium]|nr:low molecular weight phosphotyrosine protein phosphatase [Deltaproteobacteria bacterium]
MPHRLLFVCLGNICRSPTAESIFRAMVHEADLAAEFTLDSAGTGGWHVGEPPDRRMRAAGQRRGYTIAGRARQVRHDDFAHFDWLVAMDRDNHASLSALATTPEQRAQVVLLRDFEHPGGGLNGHFKRTTHDAGLEGDKNREHLEDREDREDLDVPDPYYGGPSGFDDVVSIIERCCRNLLDHLRKEFNR